MGSAVDGQVAVERDGDGETRSQRRNDLIPNLVETVKGFAGQELTIFREIAEARTKYGAQCRSLIRLPQRTSWAAP